MTNTSSHELLQLGAADEGAPVCDHSLLVKLTSKVMSSQYPDLSPHCPASQRRSTRPPPGPAAPPHSSPRRKLKTIRKNVQALTEVTLPGVIQGSSSSQPPRLTPLMMSSWHPEDSVRSDETAQCSMSYLLWPWLESAVWLHKSRGGQRGRKILRRSSPLL